MYLTRRPRGAAALTLAAILTTMLALPVSADNLVTQTISAGTPSASIANLALDAKDYSHDAQDSDGSMTLTADDNSGSGAGWRVTVQSSDFAHGGGGAAIPAGNFSITSASGATRTAGEDVDPGEGPKVPTEFTAPATLDSARETLEANVGYGEGTYTQDLGVRLAIPAQARAGTYTGTLTVTISSGPTAP